MFKVGALLMQHVFLVGGNAPLAEIPDLMASEIGGRTSGQAAPSAQEIAMQRQELRMLLEQIERLPIRLREALILVSIDGRSQAEAAELLGVSEKAIETRIYRARQKLRDRLENF